MFEDLLQLGVGLRVAAVGAYAGAFAGHASSLGLDRRLLKKGAGVLAWVGITAHSAYLVARWFAAGQVEILARERTGDVLTSADRFWYLISHPPFTAVHARRCGRAPLSRAFRNLERRPRPRAGVGGRGARLGGRRAAAHGSAVRDRALVPPSDPFAPPPREVPRRGVGRAPAGSRLRQAGEAAPSGARRRSLPPRRADPLPRRGGGVLTARPREARLPPDADLVPLADARDRRDGGADRLRRRSRAAGRGPARGAGPVLRRHRLQLRARPPRAPPGHHAGIPDHRPLAPAHRGAASRRAAPRGRHLPHRDRRLAAPGSGHRARRGLGERSLGALLGSQGDLGAEEEGRRPAKFWAFAKAPEGFDARNRPDRFAVSFAGTSQLYATGLQIARDPSTPIIYAGCFFLFVGCAIAFYTAHKRIWARVTVAGVELGGAAHRNADAFRLEFEEICAGIGLEAPKQGAARAA